MTGATADTRYKFTGREYDQETGLYYYRARYFDAGVGRFIGQDPIGFQAGDTNLYRYVGNRPTQYTDPSGNCKIEVVFNRLTYRPYINPLEAIYDAINGRRAQTIDHAFIKVSGDDVPSPTKEFIYRGGPLFGFSSAKKSSFGFGPIDTYYGPYEQDRKGAIDAEPSSKQKIIPVPKKGNSKCDFKLFDDKFKKTLNFIKQANIAYNITGPNSNSVVTQALKEAGLNVPVLPSDVIAPGWGMDLSNSNLPRWVPPQSFLSRVPPVPNRGGWGDLR